ncbi:hypothetical protein M9H77_16222 [Catharanthus roseus]|uniref:Uncharacterized protein n=1 Tax=Catharanthus roseus TaxID=4058 RepID=A0ACC0AZP6_CATRO|nr:hypothetical protein M9H77_16222 [Catharanthus roseus]
MTFLWERLGGKLLEQFQRVDLEKIPGMPTRIASIGRPSAKLCPVKVFDYTKQFFYPETHPDNFFNDAVAFLFTRTIKKSGHTRETDIRLQSYSCLKFFKYLQKLFFPNQHKQDNAQSLYVMHYLPPQHQTPPPLRHICATSFLSTKSHHLFTTSVPRR